MSGSEGFTKTPLSSGSISVPDPESLPRTSSTYTLFSSSSSRTQSMSQYGEIFSAVKIRGIGANLVSASSTIDTNLDVSKLDVTESGLAVFNFNA